MKNLLVSELQYVKENGLTQKNVTEAREWSQKSGDSMMDCLAFENFLKESAKQYEESCYF